MKHLLIPAPAFVRASRRFLKKHPASSDDLAALVFEAIGTHDEVY